MATKEGKPTIRFVAVVSAAAALIYLLSFGPAVWFVDRGILPAWTKPSVSFVYYPVFYTSIVGPRPIREAVRWYAELGAKRRADPVFDDSSEAS
jgi:hypothetical protein